MLILGIETSCDETGVALYDSARGLLAHARCTARSRCTPNMAGWYQNWPRAIMSQVVAAVTGNPPAGERSRHDRRRGWHPWAGADRRAAGGRGHRSRLGLDWNVPAIGVHHMEGHLLAPMLEPEPPEFPFVALLVSGAIRCWWKWMVSASIAFWASRWTMPPARRSTRPRNCWACRILAGRRWPSWRNRATRNGFVSPADDRSARLRFQFQRAEDRRHQHLARAGANAGEPSRRGARLRGRGGGHAGDQMPTSAASHPTTAAGGGRRRGRQPAICGSDCAICSRNSGTGLLPRLEFCTDNGAMIAYAGWRRLTAGQREGMAIEVLPRWPLDSLPAVD